MTKKTLTTESGAPVTDNQHSQTAGAGGPVLIQDHHLLEKLAHFNRERIPERVVHAVGTAAYGTFEVTSAEVPRWTRMKLFSEVGKKTDMFARFSTVAGSRGAPDTARDPRGFALKFYTEDGNWDLVGNNTPIFFIRDGIKFPDFIHSQKYDPHTNSQEPNNVWDFFAGSPEATHQFVWLFGDRGIPASYACMDGFSSHTYQWVNAEGERFWVKFHFKTDQGIKCLTADEAAGISDPEYLQKELYARIEGGDHPTWTLKVQVMPEAEAQNYRFNPFDLTKVWPYEDYPLIEVGRMTLHTTPDNYFAEVEQAAFDPSHFVPGVGPSPDRMLQARLFAYGDAHRYRLGINHTRLPVNSAKKVEGGASNYTRDGFMTVGSNGGGSVNYEPNSRGGPVETGKPLSKGIASDGPSGHYVPHEHPEDDDFGQAGALYRVMSADGKQRLVDNLADSLSQVTLPGVVERSVGHFRSADAELGERVEKAIAKRCEDK
ncbi:catalase [Pseudenhygromyxa sp. WMMC2535]|uniref:catalase n=1 Tax=Pseudenhygromyxa sp. WMMC2535 TaxID=2712867 RepID=UPI0015540EF1|nr:catalase [Pseudenhygromyxa sp. WMMC2535]NVB40688.1 catalase [Pseudenhygromyxa sp. WMMC2535]